MEIVEKDGKTFRTWTEEEIVKAVFAFGGGCNPGRVSWLRTLGINVNDHGGLLPPLPKGKKRVRVVVEFNLDTDMWMRTNYGPGPWTEEQKRNAMAIVTRGNVDRYAEEHGVQYGIGPVTRRFEVVDDE